jgi:hypothetical protein
VYDFRLEGRSMAILIWNSIPPKPAITALMNHPRRILSASIGFHCHHQLLLLPPLFHFPKPTIVKRYEN